MKKILLLTFCLMFMLSCNNKLPENLIKNAGFEYQNNSGRATPWSTSVHAGDPAYNFDIDKERVFDGESSFKIEQYKNQGFGLVAQQIVLINKNLKKVNFSAKVFTKDILKGNGLQLVINFQTDDGFIIKQVRSNSITGSTDWIDISMSESIPKGTTKLNAGIMLRTVGTAWIDKVNMSAE